MKNNPIEPFLEEQGFLIVDGGLATELEARGHDLSDALWSARLLRDDPEAIRRLHYDYLQAGADCIISASYQATIPGFVAQGMSEGEAEALLRRAVRLAREARDAFWAEEQARVQAGESRRLRPLVAASVGPYGAYLADGSEYTGNYGLSEEQLLQFHRRRWHILADSGPDLMACETIPSAVEAQALARLLPETPAMPAWFSFSGRDGSHISDGTLLAEVLRSLQGSEGEPRQLVAVGINCTPPRYIRRLVQEARRATALPIVVYPNSGEHYDVSQKRWFGLSFPDDFAEQSNVWRAEGASLIGGCCRTGPDHIRRLRMLNIQQSGGNGD